VHALTILCCSAGCFIIRMLLWLRYRISLSGLRQVRSKGTRSILFLPNHPALIDPLIISTLLYPTFQARPLAFEDQISHPVIRWMCDLVGTIPIPDIKRVGRGAKDSIENALAAVITALNNGQNVVLYPAGRAYRSRFEKLRSTSAVETILRSCPDVRIVLVRTTGLWGSTFSWASGQAPSIDAGLKKTVWTIPANGIFFAPHRALHIELAEPDDLPRGADRRTINRYLEAFYNTEAPPNTYVPYTWWERGCTREFPEPDAKKD
jgi:acyl-[acyl-carrier-protein]-phospholipid O-acyltransferase / long-chain-fatty-acid--[acyl-carrier-protein] ligase